MSPFQCAPCRSGDHHQCARKHDGKKCECVCNSATIARICERLAAIPKNERKPR